MTPKCDQAKPACARCARLKIPCTGSGVKRFVFKSENSQASGKRSRALVATITNPQPSAGPRNDKTLIASNLVHIIELSNPAYDISTYGWFVKDLPRHIGSSKSLDAAIGAFVAGFSTLQNNTTSKVHAFHRYGNAVTALRESIRSSAGMNLADRMCSIYLIAICQVILAFYALHPVTNDEPVRNGWEYWYRSIKALRNAWPPAPECCSKWQP